MINSIPSTWKYVDELENLFFFYQASEEMLSFVSPDSYRVTVHNTITLCHEIEKIYSVLKKADQLQQYYSKYIPIILDELIDSIHKDQIVKDFLGKRLHSVITGLTLAKENSALLSRWINLITQSCTLEKYVGECKSKIISIVSTNSNKKELLYYTNNFYVCLINLGYNTEFLYQTVIRFFDNKTNKIKSKEQISDFLNKFDIKIKKMELYVVLDTFLIDNFSENNPLFTSFIAIDKIDESVVKAEITKSLALKTFYAEYDNKKDKENISMVSYKSKSLDPYSALEDLVKYLNLLQIFTGYFQHRTERKLYFDVVQKDGERYWPIKLRKLIPSRPYIEKMIVDKKINNLLSGDALSAAATRSILSALDMHQDAINCKSSETMLRTFWTATEALFFDPVTEGERENAIYSLLHITEKTYFLRVFRTIYYQIKSAVSLEELKKINIESFDDFMKFFSSFNEDSKDFKRLTSLLGYNPLLRSRIYNLKKELRDCKHIRQKIEAHNKKIFWQISRIYRTRNLSTHAGIVMPYVDDVLFNLHNYFDYVVNYIICKTENNDYVNNISSLVFEAKNDNQIHLEYLKNDESLTTDNFKELLMGPDIRLYSYDYEINVCD